MNSRRESWKRVGRENPCPVCGHSDWCLVAPDGSAAICPRTAEGAVRQVGEAGYLHRIRESDARSLGRARTFSVPAVSSAEGVQLRELAERYRQAIHPDRLGDLARRLGLSAEGLRRLGIGWCSTSRAWSFPMVDARGRIRGIRLRTDGGRKFAVRGGHEGLFVPEGLDGADRLLIAEGPTDTAALLDLDLEAVGRPSCTGGVKLLDGLVRDRGPREVVIVADRDQPGQGGAVALAPSLAALCRTVRIVSPPEGIKDARAWRSAGASLADVLDAIEAAPAFRLPVRVRAAVPRLTSPRRHHGR